MAAGRVCVCVLGWVLVVGGVAAGEAVTGAKEGWKTARAAPKANTCNNHQSSCCGAPWYDPTCWGANCDRWSECDCDAGYYENGANYESCVACPGGQYQGSRSQGHCNSCNAGQYQPNNAQTGCIYCGSGYYQNQNTQTGCIGCPTGHYSNQGGDINVNQCHQCWAGQYQSSTSSTGCIGCPSGTYGTGTAYITVSQCTGCGAGRYRQNTGGSSCQDCATGTYSTATAMTLPTQCISCGQGTYQDNSASTACITCLAGTFSRDAGLPAQNDCFQCPRGHYNVDRGAVTCLPCERGSYTNSVGRTECTQCGVGTYNDGNVDALDTTYPVADFLVYSSAGEDIEEFTGTVAQCTARCCAFNTQGNTCAGFSRGKATTDGTSGPCWLKKALPGVHRVRGDPDYHTYLRHCETTLIQLSWSASHTNGASSSSSSTECTTFNSKRSLIPASGVTQISVSSSAGATMTCVDNAQAVADALRDGHTSTRTFTCDGKQWVTGDCGDGIEICADCDLDCTCSAHRSTNSVFIRPCIGNNNWGGGGNSNGCNAPSQTLSWTVTHITGTGATACKQCAKGHYSTAVGASSTSACTACADGTYQNQLGRTDCIDCGAGRYGAGTGLTANAQCTQCSPGNYQNQVGMLGCWACVVGKYAPSYGSTAQSQCTLCPTGTYQDGNGHGDCDQCPTGKYGTQTGASLLAQCTDCPAGTYGGSVELTSLSECSSCGAGSYSSGAGATECSACPTGTYQPSTDQTQCIVCGSGSYSSTTGTTSCSACPAGKYNADDAYSATDHSSVNSCADCPSGTQYQPAVGSSACIGCHTCVPALEQVDQICSATHDTTCECSAGHAGDPSAGCSACDGANDFQDVAGQSACKTCPAGAMGAVVLNGGNTGCDDDGCQAPAVLPDPNAVIVINQCPDPGVLNQDTCMLTCPAGFTPLNVGEYTCSPDTTITAAYVGGDISCEQVVCPSLSTGFVHSGCTPLAGVVGGVTATATAPAYYTSTLSAVPCPASSMGSVHSGCTVSPGYSGSVTATSVFPWYESDIAAVDCPTHTDGTSVPMGCNPNEGYAGLVTASTTTPYYESTVAVCPAGAFAAQGAAICSSCGTANRYSAQGSGACSTCLATSYTSGGTDDTSRTTCTACSAGMACDGTSITVPCAAGNFAAAGDGVCSTCGPGHYSDCSQQGASCPSTPGGGATDAVVDCTTTAGALCRFPFTYAGVTYTTCTTVDHSMGWCSTAVDQDGVHVPGEWGNCDQTNCSAPSGPSSCVACGQIDLYAAAGASSCSSCGAGSYTGPPGGLDTTRQYCTPCEGGYGCDGTGGRSLCLTGTSSLPGSSSCSVCGAGTYADLPGASVCLVCPPGTQLSDQGLDRTAHTSSNLCLPCAPGYYAANNASGACSPCGQDNMYSSTSGATACQPCQSDRRTLGTDSTTRSSCTSCPSGNSCDGTGVTVQCAAGSFAQAGAGSCSVCGSGTYAAVTGQDSCSACPSGSVLADSGTSINLHDHLSDCTPCSDKSTFQTATGMSFCLNCHVCETEAELTLDECTVASDRTCQCAPGHAGAYGSLAGRETMCVGCTANNSYADGAGMTACRDCPPGSFGATADGVLNANRDTNPHTQCTDDTCERPVNLPAFATSNVPTCPESGTMDSATQCFLGCVAGYRPSGLVPFKCLPNDALTAAYAGGSVQCDAVVCPMPTSGYVASSTGCSVPDGMRGSVVPTTTPPEYYTSTVAEVPCPSHSSGNVSGSSGTDGTSGCSVHAGWAGRVIATSDPPFYFSSITTVLCPPKSNGTVADPAGFLGTGGTSGCVVHPGFAGQVIASVVPPYYTQNVSRVPCPQHAIGYVDTGCEVMAGFQGSVVPAQPPPHYISTVRACSAGSYSQRRVGACVMCGNDLLFSSTGASQCETCDSKSVTSGGDGDTRTTCSPCPGGVACNGSSLVAPCGPGQYAAPQTGRCSVCGEGTVTNRPGLSECLLCPAGTALSAPAVLAARHDSFDDCQTCLSTHNFAPLPGQTRCTPCHACDPTSEQTVDECTVTSQRTCTCTVGYAGTASSGNSSEPSSMCQPCLEWNEYADTHGLSTCRACPPGSYAVGYSDLPGQHVDAETDLNDDDFTDLDEGNSGLTKWGQLKDIFAWFDDAAASSSTSTGRKSASAVAVPLQDEPHVGCVVYSSTATQTSTDTLTATISLSTTITGSSTASPSFVATGSHTAAATATLSDTPTATGTASATPATSNSLTGSATHSYTQTSTPTHAPTSSPTSTSTPTSSATQVAIDCVGGWSDCDATCHRSYIVTTPLQGAGIPCDDSAAGMTTACAPGDQGCPATAVHCSGSWSACDPNCQRTYTIDTQRVSGGHQCPAQTGDVQPCDPGQGLCAATQPCDSATDCSTHGVAHGIRSEPAGCTCQCDSQWQGPSCASPRNCTLQNCGTDAVTVVGDLVSGCTCSCGAGGCDVSTVCDGVAVCSGHGSASRGGDGSCQCQCDAQWNGADCSTPAPCPTTRCHNHEQSLTGNLVDGCTCVCSSGWQGATCAKPVVAFCQADQRVHAGACVQCGPLETNAAGDDPSGADTSCADMPVMEVRVQLEGISSTELNETQSIFLRVMARQMSIGPHQLSVTDMVPVGSSGQKASDDQCEVGMQVIAVDQTPVDHLMTNMQSYGEDLTNEYQASRYDYVIRVLAVTLQSDATPTPQPGGANEDTDAGLITPVTVGATVLGAMTVVAAVVMVRRSKRRRKGGALNRVSAVGLSGQSINPIWGGGGSVPMMEMVQIHTATAVEPGASGTFLPLNVTGPMQSESSMSTFDPGASGGLLQMGGSSGDLRMGAVGASGACTVDYVTPPTAGGCAPAGDSSRDRGFSELDEAQEVEVERGLDPDDDMEVEQGYDVERFVWSSGKNEKLLSQFVCDVCQGVYLDPVSTRCEHYFCRTCLLSSAKYRPECPACRTKCDVRTDLFQLPRPVKNMYNDLEVHCKYAPECTHVVALENLAAHEAFCKHRKDDDDTAPAITSRKKSASKSTMKRKDTTVRAHDLIHVFRSIDDDDDGLVSSEALQKKMKWSDDFLAAAMAHIAAKPHAPINYHTFAELIAHANEVAPVLEVDGEEDDEDELVQRLRDSDRSNTLERVRAAAAGSVSCRPSDLPPTVPEEMGRKNSGSKRKGSLGRKNSGGRKGSGGGLRRKSSNEYAALRATVDPSSSLEDLPNPDPEAAAGEVPDHDQFKQSIGRELSLDCLDSARSTDSSVYGRSRSMSVKRKKERIEAIRRGRQQESSASLSTSVMSSDLDDSFFTQGRGVLKDAEHFRVSGEDEESLASSRVDLNVVGNLMDEDSDDDDDE